MTNAIKMNKWTQVPWDDIRNMCLGQCPVCGYVKTMDVSVWAHYKAEHHAPRLRFSDGSLERQGEAMNIIEVWDVSSKEELIHIGAISHLGPVHVVASYVRWTGPGTYAVWHQNDQDGDVTCHVGPFVDRYEEMRDEFEALCRVMDQLEDVAPHG